MTIPVPFPIQPGDKLRVIQDKPHGTDLLTGDLVTALDIGIKVQNDLPVPVVQVSTAYGVQLLTFAVVEPVEDLPSYTPAEPDDVVDAFFSKILTNALTEDDDLRDFFIDAKEKLAANDPKDGAHLSPNGGGTAVAERPVAEQVGSAYLFEDSEGNELEVIYVEQQCPNHGREEGFNLSINDEEEVVIPAGAIDGLIRFLYAMRNHSKRPEAES